MTNIWGRIPVKLRERPFDAFSAVLLAILGLYQLLDPNWPEQSAQSINGVLIVIISLYLMFAGIVIVAAMSADYRKTPVFCFFGQMYGWAFMAAATAAIEIITIYNAMQLPIGFYPLLVLWVISWFLITISAAARSLSLWRRYRKIV